MIKILEMSLENYSFVSRLCFVHCLPGRGKGGKIHSKKDDKI